MMIRSILVVLLAAMILVACVGPNPTEPVVVTENPPSPTPRASVPTPYPEPTLIVALPTNSPYPQPGNPSPGSPAIPPSGYEPQPGDENMQRNPAFVEMAESDVVIGAGSPVPISVSLIGNLPSPCHELRVAVSGPDDKGAFNLDVYTLVETGEICITVLKPFSAAIPLGSFTSGDFSVSVNGELLDVFGVGYTPQPGDENLNRDQVFLELATSELLTSDLKPVEVSAILRGSLPDPCHQLRVAASAPDEQNVINLEAYSLVESGIRCITVIKPFQAVIPLGSFEQGHYAVYVNGELLGEFDG